MPRYILRLTTPVGVRYMEWSTVVDAPVTYGLPLKDFRAYYRERYGTEGMRELPERLKRARKTGASAHDYDLAGILACNRAGADETEMTTDEIIDHYCVRLGRGGRPRGTASPPTERGGA